MFSNLHMTLESVFFLFLPWIPENLILVFWYGIFESVSFSFFQYLRHYENSIGFSRTFYVKSKKIHHKQIQEFVVVCKIGNSESSPPQAPKNLTYQSERLNFMFKIFRYPESVCQFYCAYVFLLVPTLVLKFSGISIPDKNPVTADTGFRYLDTGKKKHCNRGY